MRKRYKWSDHIEPNVKAFNANVYISLSSTARCTNWYPTEHLMEHITRFLSSVPNEQLSCLGICSLRTGSQKPNCVASHVSIRAAGTSVKGRACHTGRAHRRDVCPSVLLSFRLSIYLWETVENNLPQLPFCFKNCFKTSNSFRTNQMLIDVSTSTSQRLQEWKTNLELFRCETREWVELAILQACTKSHSKLVSEECEWVMITLTRTRLSQSHPELFQTAASAPLRGLRVGSQGQTHQLLEHGCLRVDLLCVTMHPAAMIHFKIKA